jgi:hypothetical protein
MAGRQGAVHRLFLETFGGRGRRGNFPESRALAAPAAPITAESLLRLSILTRYTTILSQTMALLRYTDLDCLLELAWNGR